MWLQHDRQNATEAFALWSYPQLMDRLCEGLAALPPQDVTELRYDDLLRDPVRAVRSVYAALDLGEFTHVQPRIEAAVAEFKDMRSDATIRDLAADTRILPVVEPYMVRLGYTGR